ncbi:MAG: hypothetical protein QM723_34780 [Myxococcaceae bacterium]
MTARRRTCLLAAALAASAAAFAADTKPGEARRESALRFEVDPGYQADGGVQYFYELALKDAAPAKRPAFVAFQPFDFNHRWAALSEPLHVVMSRLVYEVDKDCSFFTDARVHDVSYINAIVPDSSITKNKDGSFRVGRAPANTFRVRFLDAAEVRAEAADGGVAAMVAFTPDAGLPESVVVQENVDFARVMGARTGEASVTWTGHYRLGPGRTRLTVFTMSYMHNVPPFFLGGEDRVFSESVDGAATLIRNLRAYRPPP